MAETNNKPENIPVCQTEVNAVNKIKAGKGQREKGCEGATIWTSQGLYS